MPGGQLVNVIALLVYTFSGAIAVIQTKIYDLDNVLKNKLIEISLWSIFH